MSAPPVPLSFNSACLGGGCSPETISPPLPWQKRKEKEINLWRAKKTWIIGHLPLS